MTTKATYLKTYHDNDTIKSKGWIKNNQKIKYWYFYNRNGTKKSEGHYINGKRNNWWLFYDKMDKINHKCQINNLDPRVRGMLPNKYFQFRGKPRGIKPSMRD